MIFQENSSSSNELILPPITSSKTEATAETKPKEEKVEIDCISKFLSIGFGLLLLFL